MIQYKFFYSRGKHGQQVFAVPYATTLELSATNRSPSLNSLGFSRAQLSACINICHNSSAFIIIHQHPPASISICHHFVIIRHRLSASIIIRQDLPAFVTMRRSLAAPILGVSSCHLS
ncbi:hypothetical protein TWF506_005447 [Arthrobotrys conoides]|uniref:Uncharacterized protein n=1 Tax=Arthrobotrys conoides TaxID=74498 RepID=A0AAN8NWF3_9PEZI